MEDGSVRGLVQPKARSINSKEVVVAGAIRAREVESMVDDPMNDAAVAVWTAATLDDCRKKGEANPGSVDSFRRHMARWGDHVFDHAESIRRRGQSD
jgi:hypothetical protein